ncbi:MAG: AraC family transcriptional regulator ligand-binding domain-containing protein [Myxococcales bacterium]
MFVSTLVVKGIATELQRHGHDTSAWLRRAKLEPPDSPGAPTHIDVRACADLAEEAARALDDPALGLTIASREHAFTFHLLGYMLLSSRNLLEAFRLCQKYSCLVMDNLRFEVVDLGARTHLRFEVLAAGDSAFAHFCEDLTVALVYRLIMHQVPGAPAPEVWLSRPRPDRTARYHELFSGRVRFGASRCEVLVARDLLEIRQSHGDPHVLEWLKKAADAALLRDRSAVSTMTERVRMVLAKEPDGRTPLAHENRCPAGCRRARAPEAPSRRREQRSSSSR